MTTRPLKWPLERFCDNKIIFGIYCIIDNEALKKLNYFNFLKNRQVEDRDLFQNVANHC